MLAGQLEIQLMANMARLQQDMDAAKRSVGGAMAEIEKAAGMAAKALGLVGIGLSAAAFVGTIKGAIEATAALKQLSEQTGATVEGLSAMKSIAKLSGTGLDQISAGLMRLSKNMASMSDEGKEASRAITAIGLDTEKIRQMKPDEAMQAIATAFSGFSDGAGKSAAAMMLFGKEGAKLLPFFNDMAATGKLSAKVTAEQAAMADDFEKSLIRLGATGKGWERELAMGMLPTLNEAAKALLELTNGAGGLREEIRKLSADGTIKEWTENGITALTYMADAVHGVVIALKLAGSAIAVGIQNTKTMIALMPDNIIKATASGDLSYVSRTLAERQAYQDAAQKDAETLLNTITIGRRFRAKMDEQQQIEKNLQEYGTEGVFGWSASSGRPQVNVKPRQEKTGTPEKDPYEAIIKSARDWIAVAQAEQEIDGNLTEAGKALAKMEAMSAEEKAKGTAATRALATELLKQADAEQKLNAAKKMRAEFALFDAKEIDALKEEGKLLNLNAISLARYHEEKKYENQITEKFYNVMVDANGELQKTLKYTDAATLAELDRAKAQKLVAGALAEINAAQKIHQQYQQEIASLKVDNTLYFDDAQRQIDLIEKEAATRRKNIESLTEESEMRKKLEADYSEWYKLSQEKVGVEKLRSAWQTVDGAAHDVFVNIFNGGSDTFKRLAQTLRSTVVEALYQMTVKKWVFSIFADTTGANASSGTGVGSTGGIGGISNLASSGNSLYNAFTGNNPLINAAKDFFGIGGSSLSSAASAGGLAGGAEAGFASAASASAAASTEIAAGATAIGAAATTMATTAAAGGAIGGAAGMGAAAGMAAIPVVGWVAAAIAVAYSLFGGKGGAPKSNYGTGFIGTASGTIEDAPYNKVAGVVGSGQAMAGQKELETAIYTDSVRAIVAKYVPESTYDILLNSQINEKGRSSNINDARVVGKSGTIYDYGPDTGKGSADAQAFFKDSIPKIQLAIITDAFRSANADYKSIADSILGTSTDLTDAISGMTADAAATVMQNMAGLVALFDQIKATMNPSITGEATAAMAKMAGGFANLSSAVASYYDHFYTAEEKQAQLTDSLAKQFEALNLKMPTSAAGFRQLVEGLDTTTEAGQKTFVALMALEGGMATVAETAKAAADAAIADAKAKADATAQAEKQAADAAAQALAAASERAKQIATQRADMEIQLLQASGDVAGATAIQRQRELAALDASLRPLQEHIYLIQDQASALEKANASIDVAYSALERSVSAERGRINAQYDAQTAALEAQANAAKEAARAQAEAAGQSLAAIKSIADALKNALKSVQVESLALDFKRRNAAAELLNRALASSNAGGSLTSIPGLQDALATVSKPSQQFYSTFEDYAVAQGRVAGTIADLKLNADSQVSVAEATLNALNAAAVQAEDIYRRQKSDLEAAHQEDLKRLDDTLTNAKAQIDALRGIDNSVLSVRDAIAGLKGAMAAFQSASGGGGSNTSSALAGSGSSVMIGGNPTAVSSASGSLAAANTPISDTLAASLSGYMGYNELAMKYGKGWADQAMNDPSGSLWTNAIMNKLYNTGVDMNNSDLAGIFGQNVPTSAQAFGDALSAEQWNAVKASTDPTKAFGDIINGILGVSVKQQDPNHMGVYDRNGFLLANSGSYYVGAGGTTAAGNPAYSGAEWGLSNSSLPADVLAGGAMATVNDINSIADRLTTAAPATAIETLYQSILGRSPEAAGVDYWSQQLAAGMTTEQLAAQLMMSPEYMGKLNGFAVGGVASAGLYLAGERGPELIASDYATRIFPADQTSALLSRNPDSVLLEELRALRLGQESLLKEQESLREDLRIANTVLARNTGSTARQLEEVTRGETTVSVRVTA